MRLFKTIRNKVKSAVRRLQSKFDSLGSYTGSPTKNEENDKPQQDADDL